MKVSITGAWHSPFGKLENETLYSLYDNAVHGALSDAGLEGKDIDGIFVANYSGGGFNQQENISSYGVNIIPELRFKPMFRVETACASGSSAVHLAMMSIMSGMMKRVLVVGLEKMTAISTSEVSRVLSYATYWPEEGKKNITAPCMFSDLANGWMKKYDISEDSLREYLATIAAKAYHNASENPVAHIRKPRTKEEILALPEEKNPVINAPLRLHDCSLISDGAASLVLEAVSPGNPAIEIAGFYNGSDYLDLFGKNKVDHFLEGASFSIKEAMKMARTSIKDIQLAEVHDCFTITELMMYSAMGLTDPGREFEALDSNIVFPEGECPVNLSGGLKAKGHPIGATGVAMHAHIYKQLSGKPYGISKDADTGMVVNIGGSGTSNAVSIIRRA